MATKKFEVPEMLDDKIQAYVQTDFYGNLTIEIPQLALSIRLSSIENRPLRWLLDEIEDRLRLLREKTRTNLAEHVKDVFDGFSDFPINLENGKGYFKNIAASEILTEDDLNRGS